MKPGNALIAASPTTVFAVMTALATQHGAVNLGQGFPDTDGPEDVRRAAADALFDGRNQYAPLHGLPELREAVAAANARFYGLTYTPNTDIVVTGGATEALHATFSALLNPGDEVVLIEPMFDTYLPVIKLLGAVPRFVRLLPPDWRLTRAALAAAFSPRTKALVLNSPMNPNGKLFTPEELALIADHLAAHDAYAICDEVYEHLVFAPHRHIPLATLPGLQQRCLRIGSAGKTFSLTGWKVGYVSAPAPLATLVAKAHQNTMFSVAPNLQRGAATGLRKDDCYFTTLAAQLAAQKTLLHNGLSALGFDVLESHGGYFLVAGYANLPGPRNDTDFSAYLTQHGGVATIPLSAFYEGEKPQGYVRFAFCKQPQVLQEALTRLEGWKKKGQGASPPGPPLGP